MGCSSSSPATSQDETGSVEPESFSFKRTASSYENGESFSRRIVVSNEADASSGGDPGLADPAPVGAHLIVYTSFVCFRRSWTGPSRASDHIFAV